MSKKDFWLKFGLLGVVVVLIYANTFQSEFHLDDIPFIVKNPTIRDITNLDLIGKSILGSHARHVVFFSFALNFYLNKLDVFGYHLFNTLIHLLTALGIWQFTRLLLMTPRFTYRAEPQLREQIAFFAALLFACHPANTQAITYVSQRFASMATMFYIGALAFYIKARLMPGRGHSFSFFVLAGITGLMGMLCKEMALTMPLIAILIDRTCITYNPPVLSSRKKNLVKTKPAAKTPWTLIIGLGALVMIIPLITKVSLQNMFSMGMPSSSHEGDMLTFYTFMLTQFRVIGVMLRLLILPFDQNLDYDFPMSHSLFDPVTTVISLAVIIGLLILAWKTVRKEFLIFFGIAWFFITYAPEFYPRVHVIFEHKLYLTSIGFFVAFSGLMFLHRPFKEKTIWVMVALCAILGILTVKRNAVWKTEQTLWEDIVKKSPNKYRANLNLGNVYQLQGLYDKAFPYYDQAIKVMPYGYKALNSRAVLKYMKGDVKGALEDLDLSIRANPQYDDPYNNRGNIRRQQGDFKGSIDDYTQAIAVSQFAPIAFKNRADVYGHQGQIDLAIADYQTALKMDPKLREAYNNAGNLLKQSKRYADAIALYNSALRNNPANGAEYLVGLGNVSTDTGKMAEALSYFEQAIVINPSMPEAVFNAGVTAAAMGNATKADAYYTRAIEIMPTLAVAYNNRGDLRRNAKRFQEAIDDFAHADQLAPKNPIIRRNLIRTFAEAGDKATAERLRQESISSGVSLESAGGLIPIATPSAPATVHD